MKKPPVWAAFFRLWRTVICNSSTKSDQSMQSDKSAVQTSSAVDKAWADHQVLDHFYGHLPPQPRRTPMRELISTVLSHRTTHADEELAYDRMLEAFGDWAGVEAAPTAALAHAIRTTRWPDTLPRIKSGISRSSAQSPPPMTLPARPLATST